MTDKPVAPSAPAYEPEKWNNLVTPERLKEFLSANWSHVLKVTNRDAFTLLDFPGSPGFDHLSHREKLGKIDFSPVKSIGMTDFSMTTQSLRSITGLIPGI